MISRFQYRIPQRLTKYSCEWEKTHAWLKHGKNPNFTRHTLCYKLFFVSGVGLSQVISNEKLQSHQKAVLSQTQSQLLPTGHIAHTHGGLEVLSPEMQAVKAEIFETFHSFSSAEKDGEQFWLMLPDHPAAGKYRCSSTKSAYLLWHGISEVLEAEQIQNIKDVPYAFKFDETTTSQVFKQYDVYLCYWSPMYDEVVNAYAGSLFMGHCTAVDLVTQFYKIVQPLGLKGVNLLHLGMDGPQVNTKFEKELIALLHEKEETPVVLLGICSLHPVYTTFKNRISEVDFPFETFFNDFSFFFKLSAARREDYVGVGFVTRMAAEFTKKFGATWWVYMKQV